MSKLWLREWAGFSGNTGGVPILSGFIKQQPVLDYSSAHQESAAFGENTRAVEWSTDGICSWALLQNGETGRVATTADQRYPANAYGVVAVVPGSKISVAINT